MSVRARSGSAAARLVPWTLVVALLVLLVSVVQRLATRESAPYAPPRVSDPEQQIDVWEAVVESPGRGRTVFRLVPLHADAGQQRFEARTIAARLELPKGEPWRLETTWERREAEAAGEAPQDPARANAVIDAAGTALVPLTTLIPPARVAPLDPVASVFGTWCSADGLRSTVVLWGGRPGAGLRTAWIDADGQARGAGVELASGTLRRGELEVPLARVDARAARTKTAAASSEDGREPPPDPNH